MVEPTTLPVIRIERDDPRDAEIARLRADLAQAREAVNFYQEALNFYADPVAWKKKHDPEDDVQIPDFYSETSFGDIARAVLAK